jgi:hypothetical protein
MPNYSFIGKGPVRMRVADSAAPLLAVGNCSKLTLSIEEETKELPDYTDVGGGDYAALSRIKGVTASLTVHDLSPENLGIALRGDVNAIAAGAVTDEAVGAAYASGLLVTDYPIDILVAPVVEHAQNAASARANSTAYVVGDYYLPAAANGYVYKCTVSGTSAGSPPSFSTTVGATFADGTATFRCVGLALLVVTTDYEASAGGITLVAAPRIYDGEQVIVSYTKEAGNAVEALLNAGQEYEMHFDGLNEAQSGRPVTVHVFKLKVSPAGEVSLIGDEFAALDMSGKVLKDTTKNGTTVSQYFKIQAAS